MKDLKRNAVAMAEDYLNFIAFSKKSLKNNQNLKDLMRLTPNMLQKIDVNWREQAVRMAGEYLDYMNFSKQGLIDQLIFEGFSREDVTYAAEQVEF